MEHLDALPQAFRRRGWGPLSAEPDHPLAALDGQELAGGVLRVLLGRSSRFGARYFAAVLESNGALSNEAVASGLHHAGSLPSYNWIEVAETNRRLTFPDGRAVDLDEAQTERLFTLLLGLLPPGGHLMVEYDSPERAETARALAHNVPAIATPLGELLFRVGFGAHFKDWQIAEGGSEGPRKLQAYKPPSEDDAGRWRKRAAEALRGFLDAPLPASPEIEAARRRAQSLLPQLTP